MSSETFKNDLYKDVLMMISKLPLTSEITKILQRFKVIQSTLLIFAKFQTNTGQN